MGNHTFLFTDIEGSTRLWEEDAEAMRQALARHDSLLRDVIESSGGRVFKTTGDGFCAVFPSVAPAAQAALAAQLALWGGALERVPTERVGNNGGRVGSGLSGIQHASTSTLERSPRLKVRMALHTGEAELRDGDYFGATLSRVTRLLDAGHGGQILLSGAAQDALGEELPAGVALKALGVHRLRNLQDPERIFQMLHPELPGDFAPLRTVDAPWIAHHSQASTTMRPPWLSLPASRTTPSPPSRRDAAFRARPQSSAPPWSSRRRPRISARKDLENRQ